MTLFSSTILQATVLTHTCYESLLCVLYCQHTNRTIHSFASIFGHAKALHSDMLILDTWEDF